MAQLKRVPNDPEPDFYSPERKVKTEHLKAPYFEEKLMSLHRQGSLKAILASLYGAKKQEGK